MPALEYTTCSSCGRDFIPANETYQGLCPECKANNG